MKAPVFWIIFLIVGATVGYIADDNLEVFIAGTFCGMLMIDTYNAYRSKRLHDTMLKVIERLDLDEERDLVLIHQLEKLRNDV